MVPLDEVSDLALAGPVSLTTPAIHELLRRDIPVVWMSSGFWFLGSTGREGPRSAAARTAQYEAAADPLRRLAFARSLIGAKVRNQRTILRRNWRGDAAGRDMAIDRLAHLARKAEAAADIPSLLGIEGEAAALYFRALPALFSEAVAALPAFSFENRNRRPPADPVNACLSLAYALLTRTMSMALVSVGLDPWEGALPCRTARSPIACARPDGAVPPDPRRQRSADRAQQRRNSRPTTSSAPPAGCNLTPAARAAADCSLRALARPADNAPGFRLPHRDAAADPRSGTTPCAPPDGRSRGSIRTTCRGDVMAQHRRTNGRARLSRGLRHLRPEALAARLPGDAGLRTLATALDLPVPARWRPADRNGRCARCPDQNRGGSCRHHRPWSGRRSCAACREPRSQLRADRAPCRRDLIRVRLFSVAGSSPIADALRTVRFLQKARRRSRRHNVVSWLAL